MLKTVSEQEGLEGWVQSKITKAADYMGSVYHHLDYDMKFAEEVVSEKQLKKVTVSIMIVQKVLNTLHTVSVQ